MSGRWLIPFGDGSCPPELPVLLCLPQAGSGCGRFRPWQHELGPGVAVTGVALPGRESRFADPPAAGVVEVVDAVVGELTALVDPAAPLVVFGHSFGGLLGYEVTRRLHDVHGRDITALVVAASRPPHANGTATGSMGDQRQRAGLASLLPVSEGELDEDIRELMLEVLARDVDLSLTYRDPDGAPVHSPLHVWGGDDDAIVDSESLDAWRAYAAGPFARRQFAGGHDFCTGPAHAVVSALTDLLTTESR